MLKEASVSFLLLKCLKHEGVSPLGNRYKIIDRYSIHLSNKIGRYYIQNGFYFSVWSFFNLNSPQSKRVIQLFLSCWKCHQNAIDNWTFMFQRYSWYLFHASLTQQWHMQYNIWTLVMRRKKKGRCQFQI